ncbi:HAMP domain-containing methyl-accepting chemotaxis protein [Uliginosibacterium gangwonense]|uniref:HAMP domain-containing methyl-accepting chemotaxis protein n=1 Tax=Uliginosibacterium gangwonense TaxID=392736 RepID=UPI000364EFDC|nr:methyl-accepting chemotaxis protein [Uliginosibacterium gangwonense]
MTIAQKLTAFICFAVLTLLVTLGVTLYENQQIKTQQDFIGNTVFPSMRSFRDITEHVGEYRRLFTSFQRVVNTPEEKSLHVVEDMEATAARLDKSFAEYAKTANDADGKALFDKSLSFWKVYFTTVQESIPVSHSGDVTAMDAKRVVVRQAGADFFKAMKDQVAYLTKLQEEAQANMSAAQHRAAVATSIVVILAAAILSALGWELYRTSVKPLRLLSQTIERIKSERNLTLRLPVKGQDEVAVASRAINALVEDFNTDFVQLRNASKSLHDAALGLTRTAGQVAETVSTQSEVSTSIAAATEELTVSIHHVADRAHDSRNESNASGELAKNGVGIIGNTVTEIQKAAHTANEAETLMGTLQTRAAEIEKVVGVIRSLADQTNLLALNAAIEAARAGEQGRGFAVVADEVRKLAEDTTRATGSVTESINNILTGTRGATGSVRDTVTSVAQGVARTNEASEVVTQISEHAQHAVMMAEEISEALREQTSAADAIARQVEQLAQMAESNREASERTNAAATDLNTMASQLNSMVMQYRLNA